MIGAGTYRLRRDVNNPSPDRRYRNDWRSQPVWRAGTLFVVVELQGDVRELRCREARYSHQSLVDVIDDLGRFARIALALEPVEERPSDYLARQGYESWAAEVLDRLVKDGALTMARVELALSELLRVDGEDQDTTAAA